MLYCQQLAEGGRAQLFIDVRKKPLVKPQKQILERNKSQIHIKIKRDVEVELQEVR